MSKEARFAIIRGLNAEHVFLRKLLPIGGKGLIIKNGELTPSDGEVRSLAAQYGAAGHPGDRALITAVEIKDHSMIFEINGGPKKKKKWYQHVEIGGMGGMTPIAPDNNPQNPRGSYVALVFDRHVPELTVAQVKQMLSPVFDFNAISAAQAYTDSLPPKIRDAVKKHEVLVGMNREMVMVSKGRPSHKIRETDDRGQYEEWIYGEPPEEVQFIRLYGDEVGQIKVMTIDGQKIVRTQKEVEVAQRAPLPAGDQSPSAKSGHAATAPTLRRPGEVIPEAAPSAPAPVPRATGPMRPESPAPDPSHTTP